MRRITKITADNFKAYIAPFEIPLPKGEDLLIYGENGSGKSSLYKALRYFLASSVNGKLPFETNHFSGRPDGRVSVTYTDVDAAGILQPGTEQTFTVCTDYTQTNNAQGFIMTSHRASGFLDYSQLLKVYLNNGERPNLFGLITELLANYVPAGIDTRTLSELIASTRKKIRAGYHRSDFIHQEGLVDFRKLGTLFSQLISQLNTQLKPMMSRYFQSMGLDIELVDARVELYDPRRIKDMEVRGQVYIEVKHYGNNLPGYNDCLNEARLSAIATCLYLSSLKMIANTNDTRVLFLDDVFIGLDLGNRLPVLDIVKKEFKDYQRIITTYDKSWYLQAKEVLTDIGGWKFYEMYEGEMKDAAGNQYTKPILVEADSSFGRACFFLNCTEHPDYPASANYLRKAYEELLQKCVFDNTIRDDNYEILPAFRLTALVSACRSFVNQIPDYVVDQTSISDLLTGLAGLLHPLLHPLSHYVPDIPTYKSELKKAMNIYEDLRQVVKACDYNSHCKVIYEKGHKVEFVVKGVSGWVFHYVLTLKDNLYKYDNNAGGQSISRFEMRTVKMHWVDATGKPNTRTFSSSNDVGKDMVYYGFEDCHNSILSFLQAEGKFTDFVQEPLDEMFLIPDITNKKQTLKHFLATV